MSRQLVDTSQESVRMHGSIWARHSVSGILDANLGRTDGKYIWLAVTSDGEVLKLGISCWPSETFKAILRDLNNGEWLPMVEHFYVALKSESWVFDNCINDYRGDLCDAFQPRYYNPRNRHRASIGAKIPALESGLYLYTFSDSGKPIYVGITNNINVRASSHRRSSPWYRDHLDLRIKLFNESQNARDEEKRLIEAHMPDGNKQHNPAYS